LSALVLVAGVGWWGVPLAVVVATVSYVLLGRLSSAAQTRRRLELVAQLPQACDLLSVCLDAGLPLRRATTVIAEALDGPLGALLAELSAKVQLGADEGRAWAHLGEGEPALAGLGAEVARAVDSGVTLSHTLRELGGDARRAAAAAAEVRARRVGVRSVLPLMVCFLPAFLLLGVVPIIGGVAQHLLG
jgi:pilus assembly protein TadC